MNYGLYIGKNVSQTGHAWIGGYGDEPSSHWLEVEPHRQHVSDATITVGVTSETDLPGVLSEISQVSESFCNNELLKALNLAESLATAYEARTRLLRGINPELNHLGCEQLW